VDHFNAVIRIVLSRPEAQGLGSDLAQKVVLGERWALIWQPRLIANQSDSSAEAFLT
jgi:hypothetical protein